MRSRPHAAEVAGAAVAGVATVAACGAEKSDKDKRTLELAAVVELRKMLTVDEPAAAIGAIICCGVVPRLVGLLDVLDGDVRLPAEAAWVLTNIAAGTSEQCRVVFAAGAVAPLMRLIRVQVGGDRKMDHKFVLKEQALWAIGNMAGDCIEVRDQMLVDGVLETLLDLVRPHFWARATVSLKRTTMWAIGNFTRGHPTPAWPLIRDALPLLAKLLQTDLEPETLQECVWSFSHLTDDSDLGNPRIGAVIKEPGVLAKLVQLLGHPLQMVKAAALRACANIATGDDEQTQAVLDAGLLPYVLGLLRHESRGIRKDALWCISNITAGTFSQIQTVIDSGALPQCIEILEKENGPLAREAAWVLTKAARNGTATQRLHLDTLNTAAAFINHLRRAQADTETVAVCLAGLDNLLQSAAEDATAALEQLAAVNRWNLVTDEGKRALADARQQRANSNRIVIALEAMGGVDVLEQLQTHESRNVYQRAQDILVTYWDVDTSIPLAPRQPKPHHQQ